MERPSTAANCNIHVPSMANLEIAMFTHIQRYRLQSRFHFEAIVFKPDAGTQTIPGRNSAKAIGDSKFLQNRANSAQYACWADGSMDQWGKGGAAYILENHQQLVKYELKSFKWGNITFSYGGRSTAHGDSSSNIIANRELHLLHRFGITGKNIAGQGWISGCEYGRLALVHRTGTFSKIFENK